MSYVTRIDYAKLGAKALVMLKARIYKLYPTWDETRAFMMDVRAKSAGHKTYFTRLDIEGALEQMHDQYGRWQDKECQELKSKLLALEDQSIGLNGSGRVRMTDFYGSNVKDGNWQFSETREFLERSGVMDTHDQNVPRMIIPNYINSPSNCVAGSKYYSVCCINECEDLVDSLEHRFQTPAVPPRDVADAISSMASSTVQAGRELHPILVARLEEIAKHHGGKVPLHGRLFMQWMHHAYPRECPYPHMSGTVRAQRTQEFQQQSRKSPVLKKEQIPDAVEKHKAEQAESALDNSDECTAWSNLEELYVQGVVLESQGYLQKARPLAYFAVVAATLSVLARQAASGSQLIRAISGASGSKDFYV